MDLLADLPLLLGLLIVLQTDARHEPGVGVTVDCEDHPDGTVGARKKNRKSPPETLDTKKL